MAAKKKIKVQKKTTARKPKAVEMQEMSTSTMETSTFDSSKVKTVGLKTKAAFIIGFIVIIFALYKGKGYFIAATVNNQPISRFKVISELEKRSGKQALDSIITETLVKQEAKKSGFTVSSADVDSEVKKIEDSVKAQNQDLDSLLSLQGMTRNDLKSQIETQKLVEKILESEIAPTDKEVEDYMKANKDSFAKDSTPETQKAQSIDQLRQQKLSEKFQTWIADVKAKAQIKYFIDY